MTELRRVADGVRVGVLGPGPIMHVVVLDDGVVIDSGLPWQRRRLGSLLRGVDVGTHLVTHAHADHLGSTAWLCRATGAELAMGHRDAARFEGGAIDTVRSRVGRAVAGLIDPERRAVDRHLRDGERVGGFEVLEVPGHSPGNLALWREDDGVLIVGDGPVNVGGRTAPRWLGLPRSLNHDHDEARRSRARLAALDPQLVVSIHGRTAVADDAWRRTLLGR